MSIFVNNVVFRAQAEPDRAGPVCVHAPADQEPECRRVQQPSLGTRSGAPNIRTKGPNFYNILQMVCGCWADM